MVGRADGGLEAWDLLERSHEAALTAHPTVIPLTALAFSPAAGPAAKKQRSQPQFLAAGELNFLAQLQCQCTQRGWASPFGTPSAAAPPPAKLS